jgi:hypothetical protein
MISRKNLWHSTPFPPNQRNNNTKQHLDRGVQNKCGRLSKCTCGEQCETGKSVFLLCTHRRHHYTSTERRARAKMCLTLRSKYSESGRCRTAASEQENNCIVVMPISLSLSISQSALCKPINEVDLHIEFGVRVCTLRGGAFCV